MASPTPSTEEHTYLHRSLGCLFFPGLFLALGLGAIALGFVAGDLRGAGITPGAPQQSLGEVTPILGGVFTAIGVAGLGLIFYLDYYNRPGR